MSRQRSKGTRFETATVRALRAWLDDSENTIDRSPLRGTADQGDIQGVKIHGTPVVLEVKNHSNYAGKLKQWMTEARREAGNRDTPVWFVVFHQRGLGIDRLESMGAQPVLTDLKTLAWIAGHGIINDTEGPLE